MCANVFRNLFFQHRKTNLESYITTVLSIQNDIVENESWCPKYKSSIEIRYIEYKATFWHNTNTIAANTIAATSVWKLSPRG